MRRWHVYRLSDGLFTGEALAAKRIDKMAVPGDCAVRADVMDWQSQRVDLKTGELVDYQPAQPDADHEWDPESRRWVLSMQALDRRGRDRRARARIAALEALQLRPQRELALDPDAAAARARLEAIDEEINALRADLM